jgi:hypothetical protein
MVLLNKEKKESGTWRATLLQGTGEMITRMEVQGSHKAAARIQATRRSQATLQSRATAAQDRDHSEYWC